MDSKGDYFRFDSVFIKKSNQTELKKKLKPNRNQFIPTGFGSVWFFRTKTNSNRFGSFFLFWLSFFRFGSVFFRFWLGFFLIFFSLGSVRFGFFGFRLIKPKPNRTGRFFQNFNRFIFKLQFFRLFFSDFLGFSVFLLTLNGLFLEFGLGLINELNISLLVIHWHIDLIDYCLYIMIMSH